MRNRLTLCLVLGLLLGCSTAPTWAAITCGNATTVLNAVPADPETIAYTTPAGTNQILFVGVGDRNGPPPLDAVSVTHAGNAMTATGAQAVNGTAGSRLYYIVNPTSGTNNVVVDWPGAPLTDAIIIWTCNGVDTTNPIASATSANGNSTAPSVTVTTATGEVVVDFMFTALQTTAPTEGANQTLFGATSDGTEAACGASYQQGVDGGVMSWTISSHPWATQGVSLRPLRTGARGLPLIMQ